MNKLDKYFKVVGILAHILFFIYFASNYEHFTLSLFAFILGLIGYVYLNLKESYVSLHNLFITVYVGTGVLVCSILISLPLVFISYEVFGFSQKYNSQIVKIIATLLMVISIIFNLWYHKNRNKL